jgi:hypothetical protein
MNLMVDYAIIYLRNKMMFFYEFEEQVLRFCRLHVFPEVKFAPVMVLRLLLNV